ncbi:hypothetical protein [Vibrio harveyi]|uniref:hypothetical protein n=1 Tax=Vibrio harveyi group TaxID=717610 RepID=UPI0023805B3F|nr:hypothetical protein [Vibrio harveyi]
MTALRMVKRLDAITNLPYGVFVSEQPVKKLGFLVKLVKLKTTQLKEGERLSIKGVEALTKHVAIWHCESQTGINQTLDHVISQWEQANQTHTKAKQ